MNQEILLKLSTYNITEHRHNFACWTAARAAQRTYLKTADITDAIEEAKLLETLSELAENDLTRDEYDVFHEKMANQLIEILKPKEKLYKQKDKNKNKSEETNECKTTYGRVSKIIAIYIKTVYVMVDPDSAISKVAHPPLDRILLTNLKKEGIVIDKLDWTNFSQKDYQDLMARLHEMADDHPLWKLETFWKAS
ncbi:MAG: hypothetical protein ACKV1O_04705 [Saprospiraceae bacterium]